MELADLLYLEISSHRRWWQGQLDIMTYDPLPSVYPEHLSTHPWRLPKCAAIVRWIRGVVLFSLIHWLVAAGDLQSSLTAKMANRQDLVQKPSASSSGVLRNCTHTPLMGGSQSNWFDCEWRSHTNSIQLSCASSQRGHLFLDGTW